MLRSFIKKMIYGPKSDSQTYIAYLRKLGMHIGERTVVYAPTKTLIDVTRPWMISIGNDVKITEGVTILTHGYDWAVLQKAYGEILGSSGKVSIGDNVFIGMHTTILKGVTVGNNVVIGANSLVNKDIPDNVVVGGNPIRVLCTLDEYYRKRKEAQEKEAAELARCYRETYGRDPSAKEMREFFWLFSDGESVLDEEWQRDLALAGNKAFCLEKLKKNQKKYEDLDDFLNKVMNR